MQEPVSNNLIKYLLSIVQLSKCTKCYIMKPTNVANAFEWLL